MLRLRAPYPDLAAGPIARGSGDGGGARFLPPEVHIRRREARQEATGRAGPNRCLYAQRGEKN